MIEIISNTVSTENSLELNQTANWFKESISYSIGPDAAQAYAGKFQTDAVGWLLDGSCKTGEAAFLKTYEKFYEKVLGPLIAGWAVMALQTYKQIQENVDDKAKLWWLPRDAYPGMWAAEILAPVLNLDPKVNQAVHINRLNLGIIDEVDPDTGDLVNKSPAHFEDIVKYIDQELGDAQVIVVADSLQYAYMIDALNQGKQSFIAKAGNVGALWKNGQMPQRMLQGVIPEGVTLLPVAPYTHLHGKEFGMVVPGYFNWLAEKIGLDLGVNDKTKHILESVGDVVEATVCDYKSVQSFEWDEGGLLVKPQIYSVNDELAGKFKQMAKKGVESATVKVAEMIKSSGWEGFWNQQTNHLIWLVAEFDKAEKGEKSKVINAMAPSMTKREALFNYILELNNNGGDWLGINSLTEYLFK